MAKTSDRSRRRAASTADVVTSGEFRSSANRRTGLISGTTFGIKAVQYAVVDGLAVFEGDIVLGTVQQMDAKTEQLRQVQTGAVEMGVVITGAQFRWPNCTIPYDIDATLPSQNRVTDAIAHWESNSGFRFVLRTAANQAQFPDWVTFRPSSGCSSSVGRQGGQQFVNLGSGCTTGNAIHEIGHVVGLWHEQSREDRDSFVTIHWDKIQAGLEHNFDQHITDGDDVGAYDYGSIMHYPRNAFSVDGSDTITPLDATAQIGQRTALSAGDIAAANTLCPRVTIKETTKDLVADTRKETILDTLKEAARDTIKEAIFDPRKGPGDVVQPGPGGLIRGGTVAPGVAPMTGAVPFAVAAPHQAPAAGRAPSGTASDSVAQLDAQLQSIADALAEIEAQRETLQQQYDETLALLNQTMDAQDPNRGT
jgi:Astacin (Peptidase family M12A)